MWGDSEFNSTFSSPNANGNKEIKKNLIKHILPVTCQTVHLCTQVEGENSVFEYNHLRFNQICIVGLIRSVIKRANDVTYLIDDMTSGEISVKLQADEPDDMDTDEVRPVQQQFIENQYVKVFGIIKSLANQKNVQAFKIMPLKELNELTHHILECMTASIHFYSKANGEPMSSDGNQSKAMNMESSNYEYGNYSMNSGGLSGINLSLSNLIKQAKSSEGIHIREIYKHFPNLQPNKIKESLEFLSTEGQIYSTIDDEHFKSTDAM